MRTDRDATYAVIRGKDGTRPGRVRIKADFALFRSCYGKHERKAWLYFGSELAAKRAAMVMSLVQSARLNGHNPWEYLRDVLARLPTHLNSSLEELLPHRWQPAAAR